jgi:hypothetical protein
MRLTESWTDLTYHSIILASTGALTIILCAWSVSAIWYLRLVFKLLRTLVRIVLPLSIASARTSTLLVHKCLQFLAHFVAGFSLRFCTSLHPLPDFWFVVSWLAKNRQVMAPSVVLMSRKVAGAGCNSVVVFVRHLSSLEANGSLVAEEEIASRVASPRLF